MPFDGLTVVSVIVGFGLVAAAGAKLGAGSNGALAGLFATHGARDWPIGVQEGDAPRFLLDSAPVPPATATGEGAGDGAEGALIEELYAGPIRPVS